MNHDLDLIDIRSYQFRIAGKCHTGIARRHACLIGACNVLVSDLCKTTDWTGCDKNIIVSFEIIHGLVGLSGVVPDEALAHSAAANPPHPGAAGLSRARSPRRGRRAGPPPHRTCPSPSAARAGSCGRPPRRSRPRGTAVSRRASSPQRTCGQVLEYIEKAVKAQHEAVKRQ